MSQNKIVNSDDPEANLVDNSDKTPVPLSKFTKSLGVSAAQVAKGAVTAAVGGAGDIISLAQGAKEVFSRTGDEGALQAFVQGMEKKTGLPTTEDVNKFVDGWLPASLQTGSVAQDIGELVGIAGAGKSIIKGAKKVAPMIAESAAAQTEKLLRKQGLMPSIVPEGTSLSKSPYEAVGLTDEGVDEWRLANKVKNRQEPINEVKQAAIQLRDGDISSEQYRQIVRDYQPIIPLKEVPKVPTLKELVAALNKDKVETGVVGINKSFKDGDKVASRLDIPAYDNYDTWVVSLHDGTKTGGKSLGYAQTAVLKNVDFRTAPSGALKIATKDKAKETIARIHGDWVNETPESVAKRAEEAINSPEWTQVGMNPYRHSYFYDKADGAPIVEAEEIIQVGPLVLAKKPKYASPDDPQFRIRKNDEASPTFAVGGFIPRDDVRVSNIRANASKSNDGRSTNEASSAGFTLGNRKASVSPAVFSNKNTNETKFDDGVILNQEGKTIGFAVNGEIVLNKGVRIRGGLEKETSSYKGSAVYKGEVIDGFAGSSVGRGANVGLTAGKLNLDYSQREQEGSPKYEKLSGRYDLGNDSNITGDIDSEKNINVTYNKRFATGGAALKTHDGLPVVENDSGEVMSEVSITVTDPRLNKGKPTNIPSLWGGKIVDEDVAVTNALKTKKEYRSFDSIDEAVNDAVRKSNAGGANAPANYAKGGNVEQMNKLFAGGGMMDDSGEQVNGVEVPVGSLKEEVADDIPAQLSEGEFVVPADVVRFIGLEKLMQLRDKAKQGLLRMEEMGQMGNAQEVEDPDQSFMQDDEDFSSEIDDIMAEDEPVTMSTAFASGGYASGFDLTKASQNPAVDVRYFKNAEGRVMFITHINGVPLVSIPEGFVETSDTYEQLIGNKADKKAAEEEIAAEKEAKRLAALGVGAGSGGPSGDSPAGPSTPSTPSTPTIGTGKGLNVGVPTLSKGVQAALTAVAPVLGVPLGLMNVANTLNNANNAAMTAESFAGVGGLSPAAITAANAAMAAEAGRSGTGTDAPTPGSMAAAAASAGSAVNSTNAMDAMMGAIMADKGTPGTGGSSQAEAEAQSGMQPGAGTPGNPNFSGPPEAGTVPAGYGGGGGGATAAEASAAAAAAAAGPSDSVSGGSDDGSAGGGPGDGGGNGSHICTASYNQDLITPSHFRSLNSYGAGLRKKDPYLMRAYDSFGPLLASRVGKNKLMTGVAIFMTNYWKDTYKNNTLSSKQVVHLKLSTYVLRPAARLFGWVLIKFVDKK